jgi:hypothetical protein
MPKTPTGAKRPADVIGNAVHVMRIATGEIEETPSAREGEQDFWETGRQNAHRVNIVAVIADDNMASAGKPSFLGTESSREV